MTTKFLDNKICDFKFYCRGVSHEQKKQRFGRFSSLPPRFPPPSETENVIFIVVSPSLRRSLPGNFVSNFASFFSELRSAEVRC